MGGGYLPPSTLARYGLKCLVVEKGKGRSVWMQDLRNFIGYDPDTPRGPATSSATGPNQGRGLGSRFATGLCGRKSPIRATTPGGAGQSRQKKDSIYPTFRHQNI